MIIIVEGPDGTGKTSLAKWICAEKGGIYFHCDGNVPLFGAMREYLTNVLDNLEWTIKYVDFGRPFYVVLDRHWPSEWVHVPILRPHVIMSWVEEVRERLAKLGAIYVMCQCEEAESHYLSSETRPYDQATYQKITARYRDLEADIARGHNFHGERLIRYDRSRNTEDQVWNQIAS